MFKTGDYIVYGNSGVCKVENVGVIDSPIAEKDEIYYTPVSYTHLRAHETVLDLVCRLLLEKQNPYSR